jgi:hypothetical protein
VAANLSAAEERYHEAVEEKKGMPVFSFHLSSANNVQLWNAQSPRSAPTWRASHLNSQAMLEELHSLREKDAAALRDKFAEVDNLKNEVERLAGEVEVLCGVVEEGLRE